MDYISARMWFFVSLLIGLSPPESGPYPIYLEGKQGFLYNLQIDENSRFVRAESGELACENPVMVNGSPLYVGRKELGGPEIKITLQQLYRDSLLEFLPERQVDHRSQKLESAFQVRIHPGLLVDLLNYLQNDREIFRKSLSGVTSSKTSLMERLLFEDEFVLTDEELRSLRQNDLNTSPPPVEFPITISEINLEKIIRSKVDFPESDWLSQVLSALDKPASDLLSQVWGMSLVIQVDRLAFHIREKRIVFDPATQRIRIDIVTEKTQISGPLKEIGELKRFVNWRGHEEDYRLEKGEIGGMLLSVGIEFKPESPDFWVLSADPQFFTLSFLERPLTVNMHITGTSSKGVARDDKETRSLGAGEGYETQILNTISKTMTQALSSRFFSDTIAVNLRKKPWLKSAEEMNLRAWVDQVVFHQSGIDIRFDSQFEVEKISSCVAGLPRPEEPVLPEFQALDTSNGQRWGFVWGREGREWKYVRIVGEPPYPSEQSLPQIDIAHRLEFLDWLFRSAWYAGEFCFDTGLWWPRPAEVPRMQLRFLKPPKIIYLGEKNFRLDIHAEITRFEREVSERQDHYNRVSSRRSMELSIPFSSDDIRFNWRNLQTRVETFNDEENALVHEIILSLLNRVQILSEFESAQPELPGFSLRHWVENLSRGGLRFKEAAWGEDRWISSVQLTDFQKIFRPATASNIVVEEQIADSALFTQIDRRPSYWVEDPLVEISWHQKDSEKKVFYSWQLVKPGENAQEAPWSAFDTKENLQLLLSEKGLYQFQVRAMDQNFQIEFPSQEVLQFYYLGLEQEENSDLLPSEDLAITDSDQPSTAETSASDSEPSKETSKASKASEPHRVSSKGAFGCSTQADAASTASVDVFALVLLFWALVKRRSGGDEGRTPGARPS